MKHLAVAATLLVSTSGSSGAADIVVRVGGLSGSAGLVRVAACTQPEFLKTCRLSALAPARPGSVTVTLRDVPPGRYAIQAHHDRDGNGAVDRSLIGMPVEGVGFSRDAPMVYGPPSFTDAAIEVGARTLTVPITLRFEPAG